MKLNKNTIKAKNYLEMYRKCTCTSIFDFYGNPSRRKEAIENHIIQKMDDNNCYGYKVLCGNSSFFTCAYRNEKTLFIETFANTFEIDF